MQIDNVLILPDGSVEHNKIEVPDDYFGNLDQAKASKLSEISTACESTIYSGCDVTLTDGTKGHISLTANDQMNLTAASEAIKGGAATFPYHLDGTLCKSYSSADIGIMVTTGTKFILYHTTYCNHINVWVKRCTTADEVNAITYGSTLPDDLKANMEAIVGASAT
jgi:hypothetical protein